jgi:hypothetical protein
MLFLKCKKNQRKLMILLRIISKKNDGLFIVSKTSLNLCEFPLQYLVLSSYDYIFASKRITFAVCKKNVHMCTVWFISP